MSKIQSEKERKLQKRLIPLNIFVCILCLVATFSLIFAPIVKVDVGKMVHNDGMEAYLEDMVGDMVGGSTQDSVGYSIDMKPVISTIVSNILNTVEGSVEISAYNASKVAFAKGDQKTDTLMNELFFGEKALVTKLVDSIVDGVGNMLKPADGESNSPLYNMIEETLVSNLTTQLVQNFGDEHIDEASVKALTDAFHEIENVEDGDVTPVVDKLIEEMSKTAGSENLVTPEEKESITKEVQKIYDETAKQLGEDKKVTTEAVICVYVSQNVDLNELNINNILSGLLPDSNSGEDKPEGSLKNFRAVDGEITDGTDEGEEGENPETGEGEDTDPPENTEEPDEGENTNPPENTDSEDSDRKIVVSFAEVLEEMGLDDEQFEGIKDTLKTTLRTQVDGMVEQVADYLQYYGFLFYGILAFTVPWIVLFLFSLIHIFTKNKRFVMWYVKLFCFIPALISLALVLAPKIVPIIPGLSDMLNGEQGPLISAALSGISSLMWISGLCYLLLWLVSICWAFPIKHQIRKERKAVKTYGISDDYNSGSSGGGGAISQPSYDNYNSYDDDVDGFNSPYHGSLYGLGYDSGYTSDYGYGSIFDDDDDDLF